MRDTRKAPELASEGIELEHLVGDTMAPAFGALIGYARVSTEEQNLDLQVDALKRAGCAQIYSDKVSGAASEKPGLEELMRYLRQGDTLVVWKLDRLGRTVKGLVDFVESLHDRQVHFKSLTDSIDTTTPSGRFFFHVMAAMAQMERELIRERTRAGLSAARARGRLGGRKPSMDSSKIQAARQLLDTGMSASEVAGHLGVSRATIYRSIAASAANALTRDTR
jgi:DNA invertase Pin-like site-specific DNA recombinase